MQDITTDYAGLKLSSPIIAASSNTTATVRRMRKAQDNGAGAVVVKSLIEKGGKAPAPRFKLINNGVSLYSYEPSDLSPEKYVQEIIKAKKELDIPVIASIACMTDKIWVSYAKSAEDAGADALELNLSCPLRLSEDIADKMVHVLRLVKDEISIPVIPKLTPQLTNPLIVAKRLEKAGADALVMFNRFSGLEIDIRKEKPVLCGSYCGYGGRWLINYSLRWVSAAYPKLDIPISGSGGIMFSSDVIKYLLSGAATVQVCTAILRKGYGVIKDLNKGLKEFMIEKEYTNLDEFKGKIISGIIPGAKRDGNKRVDEMKAKVRIRDNKCNNCGLCRKICVSKSIDQEYRVMPKCDGCGLCVELCPRNAISQAA